MKKNLLVLALVAGLVSFVETTKAAVPNYLLTINVSDPYAVTITATGNFASVGATDISSDSGVTLLSFFRSSLSAYSIPFSGNLAANGMSGFYDNATLDNYSGSNIDLNLYSATRSSQNFTTSDPAFTGSATLDLHVYNYSLPTIGTTGNILDGSTGGYNGVIGVYQVVPEPSTYALLGLGTIGMLMMIRRKKTA